MSDGVDSELILEKEELRLSESGENRRGEVADVEEPSDGVVSLQMFRIRPGKRRGSGAVFRFPRGLPLLDGIERGTNVVGSELGPGFLKTLQFESGARTIG